jgi:hypothetical protein
LRAFDKELKERQVARIEDTSFKTRLSILHYGIVGNTSMFVRALLFFPNVLVFTVIERGGETIPPSTQPSVNMAVNLCYLPLSIISRNSYCADFGCTFFTMLTRS